MTRESRAKRSTLGSCFDPMIPNAPHPLTLASPQAAAAIKRD